MRASLDLERDHSLLSDRQPYHLPLEALLAQILKLLKFGLGPLDIPNIKKLNIIVK